MELYNSEMTAEPTSEPELFGRVIGADRGDLSAELASYILSLDFPPHDRDRMHELAVGNREGRLKKSQRAELDRYVNVGHMLALLQAKARRSLKDQRIA